MQTPAELHTSYVAGAGEPIADIEATFSPKFLGLLSHHLYSSSSNKAFEELVTNSWDADATNVYVQVPTDISTSDAAIYILDNGRSMNFDGLADLWAIASSSKRDTGQSFERKPIGKFGIGKLATYILCNELTYICKSSDGVIRIVTMDYRLIDQAKTAHLNSVPLSVRRLSDVQEVGSILSHYSDGNTIFQILKSGIPKIQNSASPNSEFGGPDPKVTNENNTWTLAVMTSLKGKAQEIKWGWVKRMLSTALPLGSTMNIKVNDQTIEPSKYELPIVKTWQIGPGLEFNTLKLQDGEILQLKMLADPYPHILIEGLGEITGKSTLFEHSITGGKSENIGASNGFFVNVLGRVINYSDNHFKMGDQLNHSVFSRLRVTIRVDSLDDNISINRESIEEDKKLEIVRAFLYALFNLARRTNEELNETKFNEASKVVRNNTRSIPLGSMGSLLEHSVESKEPLPLFISPNRELTPTDEINEWLTETDKGEKNSILSIEFEEKAPESYLARYDIKQRKIIINKNHPFAIEHSGTDDERNMLRNVVTVELMVDIYLANCGISRETAEDVISYRDQSQRLIANITRKSAAQIVRLLIDWKSSPKPFEHIVGDAIEYLGFGVQRMGNSGEPEGVATAYITPLSEDKRAAYRFTYDAKSTTHAKAQTSNLNIAGLARHRDDHQADYALVVAPEFQEGALGKEAFNNKITPITSSTLAKLLSLRMGYGTLNLEKFKEIFSCYTPGAVDTWVESLSSQMGKESNINLRILCDAISQLATKGKIDMLSTSAIAQKYREITEEESHPSTSEITRVLQGLALVAPNSVKIDNQRPDKVIMLNHSEMLLNEIRSNMSLVPQDLRVGATTSLNALH